MTISPRRSRRNFINPDPMAELGRGSTKPQGVAGDDQPVHIEEEMSISQSTRTVTPRNKCTYGRKSRPRAVHQGTANRASASPNHVDDSRNPDPGEGKEEMVEHSISTKGIPKQNQRRNRAPRRNPRRSGRRGYGRYITFKGTTQRPSINKKTPKTRHAGPDEDTFQTLLPLESLNIHRYPPAMIPPRLNDCSFCLLFSQSTKYHPPVRSRILLPGLMQGLPSPSKFQFLTCRKGDEGDPRSQKRCQKKSQLPKSQR